ncbi:MAG: hypothetical protein AAF830_11405 [Pseudomonadota bacterium]
MTETIYRVCVVCSGIPPAEGYEAARATTQEFAEYRPHHQNVVCVFRDDKLFLTAENDCDPDGTALMDEFSDTISAYVASHFDSEISLVSSDRI